MLTVNRGNDPGLTAADQQTRTNNRTSKDGGGPGSQPLSGTRGVVRPIFHI